MLRKFMTSSSKIMSRRRAGTNTQEQKTVKLAIKRARFLALVPYRGA
jgi:ribosomal protein S18